MKNQEVHSLVSHAIMVGYDNFTEISVNKHEHAKKRAMVGYDNFTEMFLYLDKIEIIIYYMKIHIIKLYSIK